MPITDKQLDKLRSAGGTLATTVAGGLLGGSGAGLLSSQIDRDDETPEARKARIIRSIITGGSLGMGAGLLVPTGVSLARGEEPSFLQRHSPGAAVVANPITTAGVGLSAMAGLRARGEVIKKLHDTYLTKQVDNGKGKMVLRNLRDSIDRDILHPSAVSPEANVKLIAEHLFRGGTSHSQATQEALARVAQGRGPLNLKDLVGLVQPKNYVTAMKRMLHKTVIPQSLVQNLPKGEFTSQAHNMKAVFNLLRRTPGSEKIPISLLGLLGGALIPAGVGYGIQKGVSG